MVKWLKHYLSSKIRLWCGSRRESYLQAHLERTSRSFAFCIERLPEPFRQWIGLSYLLCRILDTIEDYPLPDQQAQAQQFAQFGEFLERLPSADELQSWAARFSSQVPEAYRTLVEDSETLFQLYHQLGPAEKRICQIQIHKMLGGMVAHQQFHSRPGLSLNSLIEINRYCYFVAGVVGELIRDLFQIYRGELKVSSAFRINSLHFGLFLQKTNLLKDRKEDELENRFLVSDADLLLTSLKENAQGACSFLLEIPVEEKGFRLFCAWSLFLALATLEKVQQASQKITRLEAKKICDEIEAIIADNGSLKERFGRCSQWLDSYNLPLPAAGASPQWFLDLVGPSVEPSELAILRM